MNTLLDAVLFHTRLRVSVLSYLSIDYYFYLFSPMDREQLWKILYDERKMAALQELPADFFDDVRKHIEKLKDEKREADEKLRELVDDEIRNARTKVEDIIRRRIGKIVKLASSGVKAPPKGILDAEVRIFEDVRRHVEEGKESLLALILNRSEEKEREKEKSGYKEITLNKSEKAERNEEEEGEEEEREEKKEEEEGVVVRILDDIDDFVGTDGRTYKVKREDIIMLPKINAEILCKRGFAERFDLDPRTSIEKKQKIK